MRLFFRLWILAPLLALSFPLTAQTLDREAVLTNLIEAYGGEGKLRKLNHAVQEWDN